MSAHEDGGREEVGVARASPAVDVVWVPIPCADAICPHTCCPMPAHRVMQEEKLSHAWGWGLRVEPVKMLDLAALATAAPAGADSKTSSEPSAPPAPPPSFKHASGGESKPTSGQQLPVPLPTAPPPPPAFIQLSQEGVSLRTASGVVPLSGDARNAPRMPSLKEKGALPKRAVKQSDEAGKPTTAIPNGTNDSATHQGGTAVEVMVACGLLEKLARGFRAQFSKAQWDLLRVELWRHADGRYTLTWQEPGADGVSCGPGNSRGAQVVGGEWAQQRWGDLSTPGGMQLRVLDPQTSRQSVVTLRVPPVVAEHDEAKHAKVGPAPARPFLPSHNP